MWTMETLSSAKALSSRSTCCGSCGREEVKWSYRSNKTFWGGTGYELLLLLGHCSSIQKALSGPAAIVGCLPLATTKPRSTITGIASHRLGVGARSATEYNLCVTYNVCLHILHHKMKIICIAMLYTLYTNYICTSGNTVVIRCN